MEAVKFLLVSCIGIPRLTAVKECTEFGLYGEVKVVPDSLVKLRHDCYSLGYSAVYLSIDSK